MDTICVYYAVFTNIKQQCIVNSLSVSIICVSKIKMNESDTIALNHEAYLSIKECQGVIKLRYFLNLDWSEIVCENIIFENCHIVDSNFKNADLRGISMTNCKIYNCNFNYCNLEDSIFENCIFYDKEKELGCSFYRSSMLRGTFKNCDISLNNFEHADAFQINISNCMAQGCNFKQTNFSTIVSRKNVFSAACLTNTDFRYADFSNVCLEKCDLSKSRFVSVSFFNTNLEEANLTNIIFSPSTHCGLKIFKADFRNADIRDINIISLDFTGVKICDWQKDVFLENLGIILFPDN